MVNEFLRKMSPGIHESSSPSRHLHEFPEIPTCYHQHFKDLEVGPQVFSSSFAGVSGILRRREYDRTSVHALRNQAFSDLQALMNSAADVLSVLEKYSSSIAKGAREDRINLFTILPICYYTRFLSYYLSHLLLLAAIEQKDYPDELLEMLGSGEFFKSMGVVLPITKKNAETTDIYYEGIAKEVGNMLLGKDIYLLHVLLHVLFSTL